MSQIRCAIWNEKKLCVNVMERSVKYYRMYLKIHTAAAYKKSQWILKKVFNYELFEDFSSLSLFGTQFSTFS